MTNPASSFSPTQRMLFNLRNEDADSNVRLGRTVASLDQYLTRGLARKVIDVAMSPLGADSATNACKAMQEYVSATCNLAQADVSGAQNCWSWPPVSFDCRNQLNGTPPLVERLFTCHETLTRELKLFLLILELSHRSNVAPVYVSKEGNSDRDADFWQSWVQQLQPPCQAVVEAYAAYARPLPRSTTEVVPEASGEPGAASSSS